MNTQTDSIQEPRFPAPIVAHASGISLDTLNNWLRPDRGVALLSKTTAIAGGGKGQVRTFTLRGVYQVALTAKLVARGVAAAAAAQASLKFTHVGDEDRAPGELFAQGDTYLCIDHETGRSAVRSIEAGDTFSSVLVGLARGDWDFVDVAPVVRQVRASLGVTPVEPE
jgi:hypothetical protein